MNTIRLILDYLRGQSPGVMALIVVVFVVLQLLLTILFAAATSSQKQAVLQESITLPQDSKATISPSPFVCLGNCLAPTAEITPAPCPTDEATPPPSPSAGGWLEQFQQFMADFRRQLHQFFTDLRSEIQRFTDSLLGNTSAPSGPLSIPPIPSVPPLDLGQTPGQEAPSDIPCEDVTPTPEESVEEPTPTHAPIQQEKKPTKAPDRTANPTRIQETPTPEESVEPLPFEPDPNSSGTIHNLGFGPSDASRIENLLVQIRPDSPMRGHSDEIVQYANEFNVDPLLIFITLKETQLCADSGVNSPGGSDPDNFNCGNITWEAAKTADIARWHAKPWESSFEHQWTFVPTMREGIGLFFDYVGSSPLYQGATPQEFYDIYNPCSDSAKYGLACGAGAMNEVLALLEKYLGPRH